VECLIWLTPYLPFTRTPHPTLVSPQPVLTTILALLSSSIRSLCSRLASSDTELRLLQSPAPVWRAPLRLWPFSVWSPLCAHVATLSAPPSPTPTCSISVWQHPTSSPSHTLFLGCASPLGLPNTEDGLKLDCFAITMTNHMGVWRTLETPCSFL
jgi:hypothetical protein